VIYKLTARQVGELISEKVMVLHVKPDSAELVPRQCNGEFFTHERYAVPLTVVEELRPQMAVITEFGYPPPEERKRSGGWKSGWREMGLESPAPGEYWLFVQ
jgi:hypothetical protein